MKMGTSERLTSTLAAFSMGIEVEHMFYTRVRGSVMESQQTWQGDNGIINLWEYVGIVYLGEAPRQAAANSPAPDRESWADGFEPPVSLDDYLVEHQMRADAASIDELTVRQALMALGLSQRAHLYPEWVRAEAWLFMALRVEPRVAAIEILARAHDLGLSQSAIEQARVRLGIIITRQPGVKHGGWRWQLPPAIAERGTPGEVDPRWRRYQHHA
jgi:hypothetical protein